MPSILSSDDLIRAQKELENRGIVLEIEYTRNEAFVGVTLMLKSRYFGGTIGGHSPVGNGNVEEAVTQMLKAVMPSENQMA